MGGLERRLRALEARRQTGGRNLSRAALALLSNEDLESHEEALEAEVEGGEGDFWDLYAAVGERSRRSLYAYFDAYEAAGRGEEPPSRDPPPDDAFGRLQRMSAGDEEARRGWGRRNGYRIWKHYRK